MKKNVLWSTLVLLPACSSLSGPPPAPVATGGEERVCQRERRTGTMFDTKVCRTPAEIERDRMEAQAWEERRVRHDFQSAPTQ